MSRIVVCLSGLALLALAGAQSKAVDVKTETAKLKAAADAKAKEIGRLTASGQITSSDEALKLLQQAVDELKEIRERLKALEGAQEKTAKFVSATTPKLKLNGWGQFQYQDTDRKGASRFDAFGFRRLRVSLDGAIEPRLLAKVSFDLAAGANQTQEQLRDAWFAYDFSGGSRLGRDRAFFGQFQFPLGYDLERSDFDNEFPERVQYSQIFFNTERSRGVKVRREGRDGSFQAAVLDSLTIGDPEQAALPAGPGDRLSLTAQARLVHGNTSVGISGMAGDRPAYTVGAATSPEVPRRYAYLDFEQRHLISPRFTLRGELMRGNDRVPSAAASAANVDHPISGYHLMGVYQLSSLESLAVRWEGTDTDLDSSGNGIHGLGVAYLRTLTPSMRLALAHEVIVDESRFAVGQTRYGMTTFRLQVKF